MKKLFITLCVFVLIAASVRAEMVRFTMTGGNKDAFAIPGLLDNLSLTATDTTEGILFTFSSTYDMGNPDLAGGAGKIFGNSFFLWNTGDLFVAGDDVRLGGSLNGAKYPDTDIHLGTADYSTKTLGYENMDGVWQTSFVIDYAAGMNWLDFLDLLTYDGAERFIVGTHLQALEDGASAKVVSWTLEQPQVTPEPSSAAIFGAGLCLAGLLVRYRRKPVLQDGTNC